MLGPIVHQVLVQVQVQPGLVTHVLQPNLNHYASVPLFVLPVT